LLLEMSTFADLPKAHNDFFSENFHSGWNAEWVSNGTNKNGLTVTAKKDGDKLSATFKPKWTLRKYNTECKTTLDTQGGVKVEVINTDKIAKGLKLTGSADTAKKQVSASAEFNKDSVNFKTAVTGPWSKERKVDATVSGVYTRDEWSFGGSVEVALGDQVKVTSSSVGARHVKGNTTATIIATKTEKAKKLEGGFVLHLNAPAPVEGQAAPVSPGDLAAKYSYDLDKKQADIDVGFSRVQGEHTWKAKVGSSGRAAVSHSRNWNSTTRVTSTVDFNVANPADHKYGLFVKFTQ